MTEDSEKRSILVTSALPYANAPLHLGHILEHIQTDIWVRYQRLIGNDAVYVCADDAHGTPIMLKADELNITPEELIADVYKSHTSVFKQFNISHDNYHSTHSEENESLSQQIFLALQNKGLIEKKEIDQLYDTSKEMFLSDRYVKGTCPSCGAEDQYGDNCEKCSATYNAIELKNPISVLSNTAPIVKKSEHLFFKLSALKEEISSWLDTAYIQSTVRNKLNEWLNDDLKNWDISRDSPYFGFKIPGYEEKYFYVWLDAPIGYLASHLNYLKKNKKRFSIISSGYGSNISSPQIINDKSDPHEVGDEAVLRDHIGREYFRQLHNHGLDSYITDDYDEGFRPLTFTGLYD